MPMLRHAAVLNEKVPTRASLRRVLAEVMRNDSELDAFCLDYYPEVKREFTAGLLRTGKLNVLLSHAPTNEILTRLRESYPEATASHQHCIVWGRGEDVLPTSLLDARERRNRQRLLERVRKFWIEGVLDRSLHAAVVIDLGKEYRPEAVAYPWDRVVARPDMVPQPIPHEKKMSELFDEHLGELLILGAPGSGKTTMLLDLCRDLLARAATEDTYPIPVVFNLSSWAQKRAPLTEWLVEELLRRYDIPRSVGTTWVDAAHILPLLDGLDEVSLPYRAACVEALNEFRAKHSSPGCVVCSRSEPYAALPKLLRLESAVVVQPLSIEQIDVCLSNLDEKTQQLRALLRHDRQLLELASTPLMLSIMLYVHQGGKVQQLPDIGQEQQRKLLLGAYCTAVMRRRRFSDIESRLVLNIKKTAQIMAMQEQTIFHFEELQPSVLTNRKIQRLCYIGAFLLAMTIVHAMSNLPDLRNFNPGNHPSITWSLFLFWKVEFIILSMLFYSYENYPKDIIPIDSLRWKWANMRGRWKFVRHSCSKTARRQSLAYSALFTTTLIFYWHAKFGKLTFLALIASILIASILFSPLFYFMNFVWLFVNRISFIVLVPSSIPRRSKPNQGTYKTAQVAIAIILAAVCLHLLTFTHPAVPESTESFSSLLLQLLQALTYGFLVVLVFPLGGFNIARHYCLRVILSVTKQLPFRLMPVLNFCVDRSLMRQVGGGYIFIHRLFMEYFAELTNEDINHMVASVNVPNRTITEALVPRGG